ncbi:19495_t:CDS:2, partial [Racocetra persica]
FGAINGFTSEIYELLHKTNVKQPFRITNKCNINTQMQSTVTQQNVFTLLVSKFQSRPNNSSVYGITANKAIRKMTQHTIDQYCIHDYLQNIEHWSSQEIENEAVLIEVFEFAYLDNDYKVTIHASSNYYGQAVFSNVCVEMDKSEQDNYLTDNGLCYAKILLIVRITSPKLNQKLELALVHWYDFAYPSDIHRHYFY